MGAVKQSRDSEFQANHAHSRQDPELLKADYARIFKSDIITDLIRVMGCGWSWAAATIRDLGYL